MTPKVLVLMYHRVFDPNNQHHWPRFLAHLQQLAQQYPIVLPGEPLTAPINLCLTFDDAYFDFYHFAFPLLKQLNLRAILGVPVKYIQEDTTQAIDDRLAIPYPHGFEQDHLAPLCTWKELREMAHSGHVRIASHTHSHVHMARSQNWETEVAFAKETLTSKLDCEVPDFIYPYGSYSKTVNQYILTHHEYAFRIGSAINYGWSPLLYRIDAEPLFLNERWLESKDWRRLTRKNWINRLRGK